MKWIINTCKRTCFYYCTLNMQWKKDEQLCLLAVQQIGDALQWVPPELRTIEICRVALSNDPAALEYTIYDQQLSFDMADLEYVQSPACNYPYSVVFSWDSGTDTRVQGTAAGYEKNADARRGASGAAHGFGVT